MPVIDPGGDPTVVDIINDSRAYAADVYENADGLIRDAQRQMHPVYVYEPEDTVPDINIDDIEYEDPDVFEDSYAAPLNTTSVPTFLTPTPPGAIVDIPDVGDFDESKLWSGDPPVYDIASFDVDAPTISEVDIPPMPPLMPVPYPEITPVDIPEFDGVTIPIFDPKMMMEFPGPPEDIVKAYKDTYSDALPEMKAFIDSGMQEVLNKYAPEYENNRARLIDKINNAFDNGTGLNETFEQNLYDRGRARAEQELTRLTTEVTENNSKRGFFVPPGAVEGGMLQAQIGAAVANAQYSSETTIERAKLELNHLEFVMQLSDNIRNQSMQMVMQYNSVMVQINAQALDHAKNVANIMTELYNSQLKRYESALSYYSIQAQVYEVQYKASLANLEIYRVEAEVAKLSIDLNQSEIDLYVARLDAQKTQVEIYSVQVGAIETQIRAEATAVDAFGKQVQAYTAEVNAKEAEFGVYNAAMDGNKTLVSVYATEVDAYATRVSAEKSKVDVEIATANSTIAYNRNLTEQFLAELKNYQSEIQAESTRFDSSAKAYVATLDGFKAELSAKQVTLEGQVKESSLEVQSALQNYQNVANYRISYAQAKNVNNKSIADVSMAGAGVYTNIAAAALASQNSMVTLVEKSA